MADLSRKTASIYINHAPAEEALKKLQGQADKLSVSIKKGEDAGKNMVKEIAKLNDTKNQIAGVQRQIDQGLKPSFNQLQSLVAKTRSELRKMSESDPGFIKKTKDLNRYSTEMSRLGQQIGAVKKESGGMKEAFTSMLPAFGAATAVAAIVGFLKGAVDEALQADKAAGKFLGTLENLGEADAFDRLAGKADAMAERFKFIDNDDVIGVFDQLITYGKLTEAQIDELTPVIVDFAAKSRKSLDESAKVIIKALEGSGRELKEYGLEVTMSMTQSERLAVVMDGLGGKVRGAADAFGKTTQGRIAETRQTIANLKEEIGTGLLPIIRKVMQVISGFVGIFQKSTSALDKFREQFDSFSKLEKSMLPLIDRVDELGKKSKLSKDEQVELNKAIQTIGDTIPFAITQFDEYGRAIGISTDKARDFIALQQAILKEKNRDALKDADIGLKSLEEELRLQNKILAAAKNRADQQSQIIGELNKQGLEPSKNAIELAAILNRQLGVTSNQINEIQTRIKGTKGIIAELNGNALAEEINNKILGGGGGGENTDAEKKAEEKRKAAAAIAEREREAAIKKAIEDAKRLRKVWEDLSSRINDPYALMADDPVAQAFRKANDQAAKDIATAKELLDKKTIDYKQYSDSIVRIEELRMKALADIAAKYKLKSGDSNYVPGQVTQLAKPVTGGKLADNTKSEQQIEKDLQKTFINDMAGEELKVLTSTGKKKLQAQLDLLDFQKTAELKNKELTENQKAVIEEQYRQKSKEAEQNHQMEMVEFVMGAAQQLAELFTAFSQSNAAADQEKLNQNQRNYDADKNKLDRNLRQKVVSQKEYDRQLRGLDEKKRKEDAVVKKKEFERNKQAQIIQAIMSGAQAVVSTLAAMPGPFDIATLGAFRAISIGLAVATTAAQVATISAQKAPQYAKGGMLDGPRHSAGGMPILSNGRKVAEVEGGEAILSRKTVKNNHDIVSELLRASMYGNGARITPYWQQRSAYKPINYSGISSSMDRVRHFEKGGIIPGAGNSTVINNQNTSGLSEELVIELINLMNSIDQKLGQPFKSFVLLSDLNASQDIMDRIKRETTITR